MADVAIELGGDTGVDQPHPVEPVRQCAARTFDPDHVARLISMLITAAPTPRDVEAGGSANAAALIAELL